MCTQVLDTLKYFEKYLLINIFNHSPSNREAIYLQPINANRISYILRRIAPLHHLRLHFIVVSRRDAGRPVATHSTHTQQQQQLYTHNSQVMPTIVITKTTIKTTAHPPSRRLTATFQPIKRAILSYIEKTQYSWHDYRCSFDSAMAKLACW